MQPLENCIGPTIRIGQEILCLPYVGFFSSLYAKDMIQNLFYTLLHQKIYKYRRTIIKK